MANSLMQIVSDGNLSTVPLTIKFFDQSHIKVFVNNVELPDGTYTFTWSGATTITITPTVALGAEVSIRRKTPANEVLHDFQAGAVFSEVAVDENFLQDLFLLQEASEQSLVTDLFSALDMHGNKIRNLSPAVLPNDAVTLAQAQLLADGGEASTLRADLLANSGATNVVHEGSTVASILDNLGKGVRVISTTPDTGFDITASLQADFNLAGAMFIPEGEYLIKAHTSDGGFAGVRPKNDSVIICHPKAVFKAITNDQPAYAIFNFQSVSNITLIEPNIVGDNDTHTGVTGEFGMGLYIRDSHNIHIHRPNISKCWGDGVYIGQVGSVGACTNITIDSPVIDVCRRQGISIISADGLTINNPVITNIDGTPPSAGIDIEPNSPTCVLNNIKINNIKTVNTASGLVIDLDKFTDGVATKTVAIEINGHSDEGSDFGATFTRNLHPTAGSIRYIGATLKNNGNNGIIQRRWHSQGAHVITDHPVIINPNRVGNGAVLNAAGIAGYTLGTDASPTTGSGNITLINPRVIFEAGITPMFPAQISFRDTKSSNVDKVRILDMVDDPSVFIETVAEFNRTTCTILTASGTKYLGRGASVEQQSFGIMGKFSGSLVASGLTSRAVISLPPSSLWKPGLIRVAVTCCATTSGTPAANSIGYSESLIGYRHKNSAVPVGINKIDTVANANAVISVTYLDSPLRADVTVTMLTSGNTVGWDIEAGGAAGYPLAISLI